ncbi:MAG: SIMPL domain-containing protein [Dehalococcoidia bacterium]|nr:SIMPL domain-containing protein [Dehalococcoidia bacterium]
MNRVAILALAPALLLLGAACGDETTVLTAQETTGVLVTGHGEVEAPPDTAVFDVGVEVHARTVAGAREGAAQAAEAVITSVKKNGVEDRDIKTTNLSINPEYNYPRDGGQPTIVGYVVSNIVEVRVRKLDNVSKVVDDAVAAGGDSTRLQGIRFEFADNTKLVQQAREAAMKDAQAKADQLAKLGGVSLGDPLSIQETQASQPPAALAAPAAAKDSAFVTPIQPGTGKVSVDVQVRWGVR